MIGRIRRTPLVLFWMVLFCSTACAATYDHEIIVQGMVFSWTVAGVDLYVRLAVPTTGWAAIGFNPNAGMQDVKIVLGYVQDGKTIISDEFGAGEIQHEPVERLGGKSDIRLIGGKEEGGVTTIEFTTPLVSRDTKGGRIDPAGDTTVLRPMGLMATQAS